MTLQIRRATLAQVQPLLEIFTGANRYKLEHGDRSWDPGFSEQGVRWMIGRGTTYAAYLDNVLVGTLALEWEDDGWDDDHGQAGYIRRLAVREDAHGQHLGAQIIDWAASEVKRRDRGRLRLDCNVANHQLCAYYEQLSFTRIAVKAFPGHDTAALYERSAN